MFGRTKWINGRKMSDVRPLFRPLMVRASTWMGYVSLWHKYLNSPHEMTVQNTVVDVGHRRMCLPSVYLMVPRMTISPRTSPAVFAYCKLAHSIMRITNQLTSFSLLSLLPPQVHLFLIQVPISLLLHIVIDQVFKILGPCKSYTKYPWEALIRIILQLHLYLDENMKSSTETHTKPLKQNRSLVLQTTKHSIPNIVSPSSSSAVVAVFPALLVRVLLRLSIQ